MNNIEEIFLISSDDIETPVLAEEISVSAHEFYSAASAGLRPEKVFEVYSFEYQGETQLRHNDIIYGVIRNQTKGEKIRLVCDWHSNT